MTAVIYIAFVALGGVMLYLGLTRPDTWDHRPGIVVAVAFALGVSVARHYSPEENSIPTEAIIALMLGEAVAIVLACRFLHYRR